MATDILGISALFHDSAAALVRDGEIVAAAQEERFTRNKHDASFPDRAIEYCLREAGISPGGLDVAIFYEKPYEKLDRLLETYLAYAPRGFESFRRAMSQWGTGKLDLRSEIRNRLGPEFTGELLFADHHESHAASAFFPSPFEEAAILTLDAVGEWATSSLGAGRGNRIEITHQVPFPHSVGMLYSAFTYYAGFRVNSGEYKLMGLAPYGEPRYADLILDRIVDLRPDGSLWLDQSYFEYSQGLRMTSEKFHDLFGGPPRRPETRLTRKDMDLAASIQKVCEEIVLRAAAHLHRRTGLPNLVMAGGVALNCVANGRLLREGDFDDIWVQPAAGDAGGALGAALLAWHHRLGASRPTPSGDGQKASLLGPSYESSDIRLYLDSIGASYRWYREEDELLDRVADYLADETVVGWFEGRMEYGPRALGNRSIIGDARSAEMQRTMNLKIKFRESFRPFAPCVLREHVHEYFVTREQQDSPYMLFVAPVREEKRIEPTAEATEKGEEEDSDLLARVSVPRSTIPAVTHVDYSARLQTVDAERHGRFYRLMKRFYERTGSPVVVNTSFNVRGEPIVCSPRDAFRCFMATDMDCLVLEDCLLMKDDQPSDLQRDQETHRSQFELD